MIGMPFIRDKNKIGRFVVTQARDGQAGQAPRRSFANASLARSMPVENIESEIARLRQELCVGSSSVRDNRLDPHFYLADEQVGAQQVAERRCCGRKKGSENRAEIASRRFSGGLTAKAAQPRMSTQRKGWTLMPVGRKKSRKYVALQSQRAGATVRPLCRHTLRRRFLTTCRALGLERIGTLTIHHGRHKFISHALAGGLTLAEVRDAAEHSNMSVTSAYLHVAVDGNTATGELFGY
jgi:hypothetical protein